MASETKKQKEARLAQEAAAATAAGKPTSEQIEALNVERTLHPDQAPSATGPLVKPASAGGKVTVGCKIGLAYIDLQLSRLVDKQEQTQTGPRVVKEAVRFGGVVRIRGTAYPRGQVPDGYPERPEMVAGCAINPNIDRDFMVEWMRLNEKSAFVINHLIFFDDNAESVRAMAREFAGITSGFEPVNPKKDPRTPRPTNVGLSPVETEDARAKAMNRSPT